MTKIQEVTINDTFRASSGHEYAVQAIDISTGEIVYSELGRSWPTFKNSLFNLEKDPSFRGWTFQYQKTQLLPAAFPKNPPTPGVTGGSVTAPHWLDSISVGDQFKWGTAQVWTVTCIDKIADCFKADTPRNSGTTVFYQPDLRSTGFGGWLAKTSLNLSTWRPVTGVGGSVPQSALASSGIANFPPPYWADNLDKQLAVHSNGCPSCRGATELKTFSSFSYTYCPACKEDVEVLRKRR